MTQPRLKQLLARPWFKPALILIAFLLTSPSLFAGLQFDDYLQRTTFRTTSNPLTAINDLFILMDGNPAHTQQKMESGIFPWYALPEGQVSFWRPLSATTHWLDYTLWPNAPWLMHLQSLLWYAALALAVSALYRAFMQFTETGQTAWTPFLLANLATLLYVLDDAHGFAVGWLSNRNAILVALLSILALLSHNRWRRTGWQFGAFLSPALFALALLAGESALATFAYLLAYALYLDQASLMHRLLTQTPYILVIIVWRITYTILGFGAWGTSYIDLSREPLRFFQALIERAPILLLGQWAAPPTEVYPLLTPPASTALWLLALIVIAFLAILFWPLLRRSALARFWALGMLLAAIPPVASLPANRLLFFIGLGAFGLLACFLSEAMQPSARWYQRRFAKIVLTLHLIQIPLLPLTAFSPFLIGNIEPSIASLPTDSAFGHQTAIFVNAPSHFYVAYIPDIRELTNQPIPAHIRFLASGLDSIVLTRSDLNTLVVQPQGGYLAGFDAVFRDPNHPLALGQQIVLSDMNIKVLALTSDQRPAKVAFHFALSLEDPSLRWLQWAKGVYVPFVPPSVGQTLTLAPSSLLLP